MKVGLIGCGKQAPKHVQGLRAAGVTDIVLHDLDAARARKLAAAEGLAWSADADELFGDPAIALFDVATPTPSHASLVARAIDAGKHFFCEKPLCESLAEAEAIRAAAAARGVIGMVGYLYRYAPVFEAGYALAPACGAAPLGRAVTALLRIGGRGDHELWKHCKASGGGAAREMFVHMLDLALWYFGAVRATEVIAHELLRPRRTIAGAEVEVDAEDYLLVRLRTEHCDSVFVQADLVTPAFNQFVEVQYEHGSFVGSIQPDVASSVFATRAAPPYAMGRTSLPGGGDLFALQMRALVACVERGEPPARNSLDESVALLAALDAMQLGGWKR